MKNPSPDQIHEGVRERYGRIAEEFTLNVLDGNDVESASCCDSDDLCCDSNNLYEVDLEQLPVDVTGLSLGCGDPITLAQLKPGQSVLDLGSGGGIDCFLAAQRVGPAGYVIGVDMTPAMIEKANQNKAKVGLDNVEFRLGQIEALPLENESVDVVISNCVINLSPDKPAVFREIFRVLRTGGHIAVSDMVTLGRFSPEQRADMTAWAGCITGAEDLRDYVAAIKDAGFKNISVIDNNSPTVELADAPDTDGSESPRLFSARITASKV
jgi:SAM-dependent methyltransferase